MRGVARRALVRARLPPDRRGARGRPGSLEQFLAERYCIYTADGGRLYRAELHHTPWRLRPAEATHRVSDARARVALEGEPHLLVADAQDVLVWPLEEL